MLGVLAMLGTHARTLLTWCGKKEGFPDIALGKQFNIQYLQDSHSLQKSILKKESKPFPFMQLTLGQNFEQNIVFAFEDTWKLTYNDIINKSTIINIIYQSFMTEILGSHLIILMSSSLKTPGIGLLNTVLLDEDWPVAE